MTAHPSIQPTLTHSNVVTLRQFLRNEQDDVMAANSATDAEAAEYVDGVQFAIDALETMWRAAVIVSEARAQDLADIFDKLEESGKGADCASNLTNAIVAVENAYRCLDEDDTGRFELGVIRARLERARSEAERA